MQATKFMPLLLFVMSSLTGLESLGACMVNGNIVSGSPPMLMTEHLWCRCYGIEPEGTNAVSVCVRETGYSLGKYKNLFRPLEDGVPKEPKNLESGDSVIVRMGERLGFHSTDIFGVNAGSALYVLSGHDIPPDVNCPDEYRREPLLIGFAAGVRRGFEFMYDCYLFCPARNRSCLLSDGKESPMFFPYRVADIPPSGFAPKRPGAPRYVEFRYLLDECERSKNIYENDYPRLESAPIISKLRTLEGGRFLVRLAPRASYVTNCCAIISKKEDGTRDVIAVAEAIGNGLTALCRYDDKGRIRWTRDFFPAHGEYRAGDECSQFMGDGTVGFTCTRFVGEKYSAFTFRDQKVATMADDANLRKILLEVDEKFRRLFGLEGTGPLTIEQIHKGMQ